MTAARTIQILLFLLNPVVAAAAGQSAGKPPSVIRTEPSPRTPEGRAAAPEPANPAARQQAAPAPVRAGPKAPTQKRIAPRRRSVQQVIGSVVPAPPGSPSYGPVLAPPPSTYGAPSASAPSSLAGMPPVTPPPPSQLNTCTGSFCTDAAGATYHNGVGSAAVNSDGRLCNRVGNTMQCF